MEDARRRETWNHTSNLMAMEVNCHKDKSAPTASASEFNPFTKRRKKKKLTMNIRDMRGILMPQSGAPVPAAVKTLIAGGHPNARPATIAPRATRSGPI